VKETESSRKIKN